VRSLGNRRTRRSVGAVEVGKHQDVEQLATSRRPRASSRSCGRRPCSLGRRRGGYAVRTVVSRLWWRRTAGELDIGGADPILRVEAVRRGRRRRSARRKQARKRPVPRPSSGRRTSPRGSGRRRAECRAPQRARRGSQGPARREPPTRRGRAEACGDRPLPSTWVDDASRCSAGQRAIASSADADARGQHDMPREVE
jgi:hypothetical protein